MNAQATKLSIDVESTYSADPCLILQDDGVGMSCTELQKMLSVDNCDAQHGIGFKRGMYRAHSVHG